MLFVWAAQILASVAMLIGAIVNVKSILITGPALAIIGLTLSVISRPLRSWSVLLLGLSAPLICAWCALCIAFFRWTVREASVPIPGMLGCYVVLTAPLALAVFRRLRAWRGSEAGHSAGAQFSLLSLLVVITGLCVVLAIGKAVSYSAPNRDMETFGIFALVTFTLVVGATALFLSAKRNR